MSRIICWFSCGAASAVAAKLIIGSNDERKEGREIIIARNWLKEEHPDNDRMQAECESWLGQPIIHVTNEKYHGSVMEVQAGVKAIRFKDGAPCTRILKKEMRQKFQRPDDIHVFGLHVGEESRIDEFLDDEPGVQVWLPLVELGFTKADCHEALAMAGIEQAAMYRLGYNNNNCIGCVKGGMGYWNKIRADFPEAFERQARMERLLGRSVLRQEGPKTEEGKRTSLPLFLDDLDPTRGDHRTEPSISCGIICEAPSSLTPGELSGGEGTDV
jgi:hypothetical protein